MSLRPLFDASILVALVWVLVAPISGCNKERERCLTAANHMIKLLDEDLAPKLAKLPAGQRGPLEEENRAARAEILGRCANGRISREAYECVLAATTVRELASCPPTTAR